LGGNGIHQLADELNSKRNVGVKTPSRLLPWKIPVSLMGASSLRKELIGCDTLKRILKLHQGDFDEAI
jgi:hypothetical protein